MIIQDIKNMVKTACRAIDDKNGEDILVINVGKLSTIADYFVIASASSERKMKAIAIEVKQRLAKEGIFPKGKEGVSNKSWILLDYGDVMIHIFKNEDRHFYDLERIWKDAPVEELENF